MRCLIDHILGVISNLAEGRGHAFIYFLETVSECCYSALEEKTDLSDNPVSDIDADFLSILFGQNLVWA